VSEGWFIGFKANAKAYKILREPDNRILVPEGVIVDERAKGSDPGSEFEVSPGQAPGRKARLNGEPIRMTQNLWKETPNGKEDEKKDGEVEEDTKETGKFEDTGESGEGVEKRYPTSGEKGAQRVVSGKHGGGGKRDGAAKLREGVGGTQCSALVKGDGRGACVAVGEWKVRA
jgi:hypothetical protein